jgi:hypothetical protein
VNLFVQEELEVRRGQSYMTKAVQQRFICGFCDKIRTAPKTKCQTHNSFGYYSDYECWQRRVQTYRGRNRNSEGYVRELPSERN